MMRGLTIFILMLITLAGWGSGVLVMLMGQSAIHEILGAIYTLIGTVAFAAAAILGQLHRAP